MKRSHQIVAGLLLSVGSICQGGAAELTMAQKQQAQIELLLTDMNNSALEVIDTVTTNPQKALDSGCLSDIRSIDLSGFTIDVTNIWTPLYATLKEQIFNKVCNAATKHVNAITKKLEVSLEAPFGLGSISVLQGAGIDDWQNVSNTDVVLDNTELIQKVSTKTLGTVPTAAQINAAVKSLDIYTQDAAIRGNDKAKLEESLEQMLDLNTFFGPQKKEGDH